MIVNLTSCDVVEPETWEVGRLPQRSTLSADWCSLSAGDNIEKSEVRGNIEWMSSDKRGSGGLIESLPVLQPLPKRGADASDDEHGQQQHNLPGRRSEIAAKQPLRFEAADHCKRIQYSCEPGFEDRDSPRPDANHGAHDQ